MANDLDGRAETSRVGRWEGDTFVVESNGYDDRSWLNASNPDGGFTHSDEMKVVERYKRVDYGTLEEELTIIDPKTYTQPPYSIKTCGFFHCTAVTVPFTVLTPSL